MTWTVALSLLLSTILFPACSKGRGDLTQNARFAPSTAAAPAAPPRLSDGFDLRITPTSDGGAYATGLGGRVWYLKGATATLVKDRVDVLEEEFQGMARDLPKSAAPAPPGHPLMGPR